MLNVLDDALTTLDVLPSAFITNMLRVLSLPELHTEALRQFMRDRGFWRIDRPHLNKDGESTRAREPASTWHVRGMGACTFYASDRISGPIMIWESAAGNMQVTAEQRAVLMWIEQHTLTVPDGRATRWEDKPGRNVSQRAQRLESAYIARRERGTALRFRACDACERPASVRVCTGCGSINLQPPYPRCASCQTMYRATHRGNRARIQRAVFVRASIPDPPRAVVSDVPAPFCIKCDVFTEYCKCQR